MKDSANELYGNSSAGKRNSRYVAQVDCPFSSKDTGRKLRPVSLLYLQCSVGLTGRAVS